VSESILTRGGAVRAPAPRCARALLVLAAALALATVARLPAAWESGNALNHVSGVWMALADDLARGTFYRPLHQPGEGYGGTRYFPLAFVVHGGLVRAGAPLLAAGYATALGAGLLLAAGVFLLLRALGRGRLAAAAFVPLALAGFAGQHALTAVRGDLLPVALSALGLAAIAGGTGRARLTAAAAALVLAFAAKPTALSATAAAVAWLVLRRQPRAALGLAALVAAGTGAAVLATQILSGGRFVALLAAAGTGGAAPGAALRAPVRLAEQLLVADPAGLFLVVAAASVLAIALPSLVAGVVRGAPVPLALPALWLASSAAAALAVLALPGTGVNHLVELEAAAAVVLGAAAANDAPGRISYRAAPVAAAFGLALALVQWRTDLASSRLAEVREVVRSLPPGGALVSEDPLVPLLAGRRPYLLDPWTIRLTALRSPTVAEPLADGLRRGVFPAVVLFEDLDDPSADAWYDGGNLGLPLVREIRSGYRRASGFGRYHVYLPRAAPGGASVVRSAGAR
jgi:hypothetical protein